MSEDNKALKTARNLIRVGKVNSANEEKGTVRVLFEDKDDTVTDDLPLLNHEYNIPPVGTQVLCIFLGNGLEQGFCLGGFYSSQQKPPVSDKEVIYKDLDEGAYVKYDKSSKELTLVAKTVKIEADNIDISTEEGNITATGNLTIKRNTDDTSEEVVWE